MGLSIIHLHLSPENFWQSTPHEIYPALELLFSEDSNDDDDFYEEMRTAGYME